MELAKRIVIGGDKIVYSDKGLWKSRLVTIAVINLIESYLNQLNTLFSNFEDVCDISRHCMSLNSTLFLNWFREHTSKEKFNLQIDVGSRSIEIPQVLSKKKRDVTLLIILQKYRHKQRYL